MILKSRAYIILMLISMFLSACRPIQAPAVQPTITTTTANAPEPESGEVREFNGVPFVYIPGGPFLMGSDSAADPAAQEDEQPQQSITLPGFWIMRTEVTNDQYAACVSAGACTEPNNRHWAKPTDAELPVTDVSWDQANAYAQWLGGRLPTEAEWEKACRGTDARIYPWGNESPKPEHANWDGIEAKPVGSFPEGASPYGALDIVGNADEWTSSLYVPYPYDATDGREDAQADGHRVLRGTSWHSLDVHIRCAFRDENDPAQTNYRTGFRMMIPGD